MRIRANIVAIGTPTPLDQSRRRPDDMPDEPPAGLPRSLGMPGAPPKGGGEKLTKKNVCVVFLRCAGEAGERLPLEKSEQFCAYLLFVGALAARLSDG